MLLPKQAPGSSVRSGFILLALCTAYVLGTRSPARDQPSVAHFAALDTTALFAEITVVDSFELCGSQQARHFLGSYEPVEAEGNAHLHGFHVEDTRIISGTLPVQEFCFVRILSDSEDGLRALSVWHEDLDDPGDASLVVVGLRRVGGEVIFTLAEPEPEAVPEFPVRLRKAS